jgi:hypothetical protein
MTLAPRHALWGWMLCAALVLASACGGDSGTGPNLHDQPPVDTTSQHDTTTPADTGSSADTVTVSATTVNAAAVELYAMLATGQDASGAVTGVLQSFMPVLGAADSTVLDSLLAVGFPVATDFEVQLVAQALRDGDMVSLDNFIGAAAAAGATAEDPAGPLTREYLTAKFAPRVDQQTYTSGDIVPAMVLALGRARAQLSSEGLTDPVWGDDQLDALQTMLLLYAVDFSGAAEASSDVRSAGVPLRADRVGAARAALLAQELSTPAPLGPGGKFAINTWALSHVSKWIKFPLGYIGGTRAAICASVLLYSYKFRASQSQDELWHHDPSKPDHPYQSQLNTTLVFDFVPNTFGKIVLKAIDCPVPPPGPAAGKTVNWEIDDTLQIHGSLTRDEATTDANGQASSTYETVPELVPAAMQELAPKFAVGSWQVHATGLIPMWANLERSVDLIANPTDTVIAAMVVNYHQLPTALNVTFHDTISSRQTDPGETNFDVTVHGTGQLVLTDSTHLAYQGQVSIGYDNFAVHVVDAGPCDEVSPAGTTPGQMLGLTTADSSPDAPSSWNGLKISLLPETGDPMEKIQLGCDNPVVSSGFFVGAWSALRLTPPPPGSVDTVFTVGRGTLRRAISRTGPIDGLGTVTENGSIDLEAVLP